MPELRRDPVLGYWTIISTERGWRPAEYQAMKIMDERPCPFCEGREGETTHEIFAIRKPGSPPDGPGWQVRAILSKLPILTAEKDKVESHGQGIYDYCDGIGQHELIIETPQHLRDLGDLELDAVQKVIEAYLQRLRALETDRRFMYALLFKNHGLVSGSARDVIRHSRSQIIAMPIIPKRVKEELVAAKNYFERRDRCLFCDIFRQESSDGSRIVAQNESFFCFCPFAARSPFEMWILPKKHCADFGKLSVPETTALAQILKECLSKLHILLNDPPFNFILHTAPFRHKKREVYWKTIEEDTHWYLQISPRLTHNAGFEWGTGIHINPTPPEDAALLLRDTDVPAA